MGKCLYCNIEVSPESVIEICENCGIKHHGPKLFKAIVQNMEQAKSRGDLDQGAVN